MTPTRKPMGPAEVHLAQLFAKQMLVCIMLDKVEILGVEEFIVVVEIRGMVPAKLQVVAAVTDLSRAPAKVEERHQFVATHANREGACALVWERIAGACLTIMGPDALRS